MTIKELFNRIHDCSYSNTCSSAELSLEKYTRCGGNLNAIEPISGWAILHCAAEHQDLELIKKMGNLGADFDVRSAGGDPAIFQALDSDIDGAIQCGEKITFEVTLLFLENGSDITALDRQNESIFEFAKSYGLDVRDNLFEATKPYR